MISYKEWPVIYEDRKLDVRRNPEDPEEYGINIKNTERYLLLPRGTLEELAKADSYRGKGIIESLVPIHYKKGRFFEGTSLTLTYDSIREIANKAHLKEREDYKKSITE